MSQPQSSPALSPSYKEIRKDMTKMKSTPEGGFLVSMFMSDYRDAKPKTGDRIRGEIFFDESPELVLGELRFSFGVPPEFSLNPLLRTLWMFCDQDGGQANY